MIEAAFAPLRTRSVLDDERSVLVYLHLLFGRRAEEEVWILFLDAKSAVISQAQIAKGTGCRVEIRPKTIARLAIVAGATAIIVAHNHPSGDPKPSGEDFQTTQEIEKFCASVNVRLLNHYIMSFGKWHSFRNSGHLMEIPLDIRLLV
jgi:DNA repair protein RadC